MKNLITTGPYVTLRPKIKTLWFLVRINRNVFPNKQKPLLKKRKEVNKKVVWSVEPSVIKQKRLYTILINNDNEFNQ